MGKSCRSRSRAFKRVFTCTIWRRYCRERASQSLPTISRKLETTFKKVRQNIGFQPVHEGPRGWACRRNVHVGNDLLHRRSPAEAPKRPVLPGGMEPCVESRSRSRRAAAGRPELLAKKRHTDRLQNPAKLRRFRIGGG